MPTPSSIDTTWPPRPPVAQPALQHQLLRLHWSPGSICPHQPTSPCPLHVLRRPPQRCYRRPLPMQHQTVLHTRSCPDTDCGPEYTVTTHGPLSAATASSRPCSATCRWSRAWGKVRRGDGVAMIGTLHVGLHWVGHKSTSLLKFGGKLWPFWARWLDDWLPTPSALLSVAVLDIRPAQQYRGPRASALTSMHASARPPSPPASLHPVSPPVPWSPPNSPARPPSPGSPTPWSSPTLAPAHGAWRESPPLHPPPVPACMASMAHGNRWGMRYLPTVTCQARRCRYLVHARLPLGFAESRCRAAPWHNAMSEI